MRLLILTKNKIMVLGFTLFLVISIFMLHTNYAKEVFHFAEGERETPVYRVRREDNKVAFSIDTAWGKENIDRLINILNKYNLKTTFFVTGEWAERYPDSIKALSDAGHEIMNQSDRHPHMTKMSKTEMLKEINTCSDKIEKITGKRPDLFRAPYGDYNNELIALCRENGYQAVQWDVDSMDQELSAEKIVERVCEETKSGSIILFHSTAQNMPAALPVIIEKLQQAQFSIVPVSELIYREEYLMEPDGTQIPTTIETSVLE